jgi:hypothetical protein
MALIKIKSESMNLADDYAFTGTVSGAVDSKTTCKAYVNFNGTGTLAVNESFNVSSVTDNGTGDYTANFTTNMSTASFSCSALCGDLSSGSTTAFISQSTSNMRVRTISNDTGIGISDAVRCTFIVFGD